MSTIAGPRQPPPGAGSPFIPLRPPAGPAQPPDGEGRAPRRSRPRLAVLDRLPPLLAGSLGAPAKLRAVCEALREAVPASGAEVRLGPGLHASAGLRAAHRQERVLEWAGRDLGVMVLHHRRSPGAAAQNRAARAADTLLPYLAAISFEHRHESDSLRPGRESAGFQAVYEVAVAASGVLDPEALGELVIDRMSALLTPDLSVSVMRYDPEQEALLPVASSDPVPPTPTPPGRGCFGRSFAARAMTVVDDYPHWPHAVEAGLRGSVKSAAAVPLLAGDQAVGVLGIRAYQRPFKFDQETLRITELMAALLGPAMAAAELHAQMERQSRHAEDQARAFKDLYEIAVAAAGVHSPAELGALTVAQACRLVDAESAVLRWWDPSAQTLQLLAHNDAHVSGRRRDLASGEGVIGRAFATLTPLIDNGYAASPAALPESSEVGAQVVMAVPLVIRDRPVGALAVTRYRDAAFVEQDLQRLALLAAEVAPAIEISIRAAHDQKRAATFEALHELAVAVAGLLDPAGLAALAAEKARDLFRADSAALCVWDPAAGVLRVLADNHPLSAAAPPVRRPGEGCMGVAFERGEPIAVNDYQNWAQAVSWAQDLEHSSTLAVPLRVGERPIGALAVRFREPHPFDSEEVRLLDLLSAQVAPCLQAASLFAELEASQTQLRTVVSNAPVVIFALDQEGQVTWARGRALEELELDDTALIGKRLDRVPDLLGIDGEALAAVAGGQRVERDVVLAGRDFLLRMAPLPAADGSGTVIGVAVDTSERRKAEAAIQASEAKSRFLATMSHELRTPLNSILGFAQLLGAATAGELGPKQQRYLRHISSSGHHLLELINDVLDLSKVQAGQMVMHVAPVGLAEEIGEAVARMRPQAAARNHRLEHSCDAQIRVLADQLRLRQVLLNLVSNAVKFTPRGGTLRVEAEAAGDAVRIRVIDNGAGIAEPDQQRIFEAFTQLDSSSVREQEGTGLGLALSRRLVELMAGSLTLSSRLGEGSTFTVELPAAPGRSPALAARTPKGPPPGEA